MKSQPQQPSKQAAHVSHAIGSSAGLLGLALHVRCGWSCGLSALGALLPICRLLSCGTRPAPSPRYKAAKRVIFLGVGIARSAVAKWHAAIRW